MARSSIPRPRPRCPPPHVWNGSHCQHLVSGRGSSSSPAFSGRNSNKHGTGSGQRVARAAASTVSFSMWRHARNRQRTLSKWARQCQQMMAYYGKINISQMVSSNVPETICKTVRSSTLVSHSQWMKWWLLEKGCLEWFKFTNWWMWIIMVIDKFTLYYIHRYPVFFIILAYFTGKYPDRE